MGSDEGAGPQSSQAWRQAAGSIDVRRSKHATRRYAHGRQVKHAMAVRLETKRGAKQCWAGFEPACCQRGWATAASQSSRQRARLHRQTPPGCEQETGRGRRRHTERKSNRMSTRRARCRAQRPKGRNIAHPCWKARPASTSSARRALHGTQHTTCSSSIQTATSNSWPKHSELCLSKASAGLARTSAGGRDALRLHHRPRRALQKQQSMREPEVARSSGQGQRKRSHQSWDSRRHTAERAGTEAQAARLALR